MVLDSKNIYETTEVRRHYYWIVLQPADALAFWLYPGPMGLISKQPPCG
jgi:hypothetical protein